MKFEPTDLSQTRSAADVVFAALRAAIVNGDLENGTQLRQEEIAAAFKVSRIPVREAIARLEQLGLVETRRYKGAFVTDLPPQEIEEIFRLRALVEGDAIRHAAARMTGTALAEAESAHLAFADAATPAEWMEQNRRFHCALYAVGGQRHYLGVIENLLNLSDRYLRAQLSLTDGHRKAVEEHALILDACKAGDATLAARLTTQHIKDAKLALLKCLGH
ncbi:GntR family transcriptional regulator [Gemmobacter lutimaris]|uniref:GntR family transcriptional regulator n=1 Tax=Gemmobacter lutimaris TaxID=2306023 RepID=A0A398BPX9_9RHOB|nr:GntR family transcriptional regulator [Gemmobacter lutimaris]RID92452.1 GntR family transcriptional regulator [Gemmobacter lutimaris]